MATPQQSLASYFGVPQNVPIAAQLIRAELRKIERLRRTRPLQADERQVESMLRRALRVREAPEELSRKPNGDPELQRALATALAALDGIERLPDEQRRVGLSIVAEECALRMRK